MVAVPRIRRPLRIAQHVIKALLPWLFPAHQIFERARYSASKLFHFDSYSRNSCSDAARESIASSSDFIEDSALLKAPRVVELVSEGSDGFQLLNVLLKPSRRLPNRLQSPLLALEVVAHLVAKLDFLADFAVQAVEFGHFLRDSAVDFRSLRLLFSDLLGQGAQFATGLNSLPLETVQLALGSYRPVLRLVPRTLKGLYLGLERSRGADLHLVRIKAPVALRAPLVAPAPGTTVSTCPVVRSYRMLPTCCSICVVPSGFRTFLIMACHLYAYMRMRMHGYVRMRG